MYDEITQDSTSFLLYSYFKIGSNFVNIAEMIEKAIDKAYVDATLQRAYNFMLSKDDSDFKNSSDQAQKCCAKYLQLEIPELLESKDQNDYDKRHKEICKRLVNTYLSKNICFFTYGNAQKWINMTMKYLCVISGSLKRYTKPEDVNQFCKLVEDEAHLFHVPIDSYILRAFYDDENMDLNRYIYSTGEISYGVMKENAGSKYEDDVFDTDNGAQKYKLLPKGKRNNEIMQGVDRTYKTPWSEIKSYNLYRTILLEMRKGLDRINVKVPLEWESRAWLNIAEKRNYKHSD